MYVKLKLIRYALHYTHILLHHRLEHCSKALATESRKASALTGEVNELVEKDKASVENETKLTAQIRYACKAYAAL
jgi:hypothetical protein